MAARTLQSRILSLILRNQPQSPSSLFKEYSGQFLPSVSAFLRREEFLRRGIQTQIATQASSQANEADGLKLECNSANVPCNTNSDDNASAKQIDFSTLKTSPRHDRMMLFTCTVCDTRSMKSLSSESYEKGVVVARCDGCNNLHLIADRLGWFGKPGSIEDFLASRGEEVKKGSLDTLNLTMEDITGRKA